ncbi:MAG TPA: energy transducer TonB, partial [Flavobacterium sp.]
MKLDLLKNQWLDIVFEGRNKSYGAYQLRQANRKTTVKALILGAVFFTLAVSAPLIADLLPKGEVEDMDRDIKITAIKLPPKKEEPIKNLPPPPPPPPKVDQVKFVKPVVAKAEEVTEEPPKIVEIKEK